MRVVDIMGDSMTSITSEPRMLERRISNQRAELNNDQQMNYLLAWFNNWSDLQKEDFVPVLAEKMSSKWAAVNGLTEDMKIMDVSNSGRPVSLFQCQVNSPCHFVCYCYSLMMLRLDPLWSSQYRCQYFIRVDFLTILIPII